MGHLEFSKPKSRMVEPPCPKDATFVEEKAQMTSSNSSGRNSPKQNVPDATIVTPRTTLLGTPGEEKDDGEKVYKTAHIEMTKRSEP